MYSQLAIITGLCTLFTQIISTFYADYAPPHDWDENGNYWEPLHYTLYGTGLMTWEWNPDYALRSPVTTHILALIGKAVMVFTDDKFTVFFVIRLAVGLAAGLAVYELVKGVQAIFGCKTALISCFFIIFHHVITYFMNRINMDAVMSVLGMAVTGLWMQRRATPAIIMCVITVFIRFNFVPVAAVVGLDLLIRGSGAVKQRLVNLVHVGIIALIGTTAVFLIADTLWFGRTTLAFWNALYFNVVENQSHLFGTHDSMKYIGVFMRDNNIPVLFMGLLGVLVTSQIIYAVPYALSFLYLQSMPQKQERFLWHIYPILSVYAAVWVSWMCGVFDHEARGLEKRGSGRSIQELPLGVSVRRRMHKHHYNIAVVLIAVFVLSGVSTSLLRVSQGSEYAVFYSRVGDMMGSGGERCMSTHPWSSWWLPSACSTMYTVQILDPHFKGYNSASFKRFEDHSQTGYVPMHRTPSNRLFINGQNRWNHTIEMKRFLDVSRDFDWSTSVLDHDGVDHLFIVGGHRIVPNTLREFKGVTGHGLRHERQSTVSYQYEVLFGDYLVQNFERVIEFEPLNYFWDIDIIRRNTMQWAITDGGRTDYENGRIASLVYWRRKERK